MNPQEELIDFIAQDASDPLAFSMYAYPWGEGELEGSSGPRKWQGDVLATIRDHLKNPQTRFQPLKIAIASGHGIGKSSLVAQIIHWGISTCVDCKIVVTASTETQLRTKTWPEVSKWFRLGINKHWFDLTATAISVKDKAHERTWRADAITWSENNTEAFAGLHNKKRRIILIFDEASAIADKIWEVAEGALTDEDTEIIWLAFGNPTKNTGRFKECFGRYRHRWITKQIDSRTVEGTNKQEISKWIEDYGEDSDFVRIRVKGEFPRAGTSQFIPSNLVEDARQRLPEAHLYDPLVLGVDVARFGDDQTVIVLRRGRDAKSVPWVTMRGADTMQVASKVAHMYQEHKPDAIFIDGGGPGGGVIDRLRQLRIPVMEVQFGASADRSRMTGEGEVKYANKRAEIWGATKDWLKGGAIPDDPELAADLTGVEYSYKLIDGTDHIILESKKDMKKRGLASPDKADALAVTFAYPVANSDHSGHYNQQGQHQVHYQPLSRDHLQADTKAGMSQHQIEYQYPRR